MTSAQQSLLKKLCHAIVQRIKSGINDELAPLWCLPCRLAAAQFTAELESDFLIYFLFHLELDSNIYQSVSCRRKTCEVLVTFGLLTV